ncbi:MAG TPA: enoyl-CoA hydratase/isomerase family protein [Gammaproteobacteria bacterium]|nr:enoyl-CoA hydratase/isomerase family protein [Gammaproteobacteria bacterium]
MSAAPILFDELAGQEGGLGLITLNRPQALNALNHEMILLLHQKLLHWEKQPEIKAVVVRAVEGKAFCAGGDLRFIHEKHELQDSRLFQFFRDEYRLNHYIFHYPKPYLAFLNGITMGGGAGISLHGSHCVATEALLFAMPETGIGFFPDVGGTYFLSRLPQGLGLYLGLTGAGLRCDDCLALQLIDYKVQAEDLDQILQTLADTAFHDKAVDAVSQILQTYQKKAALAPLSKHYEAINQAFLKPTVEEILADLENEQSPWHQETLASLQKKSPTSLKVTLKQLQEGKKRDFNQCLELEYGLMRHFIQGHDFFEGIRSILEKKHRPQWQPAELNEISSAMVEAFFLPVGNKTAPLFAE